VRLKRERIVRENKRAQSPRIGRGHKKQTSLTKDLPLIKDPLQKKCTTPSERGKTMVNKKRKIERLRLPNKAPLSGIPIF